MPKKPPSNAASSPGEEPIQQTNQTESRVLACRLTQTEFNERAMRLAKIEDDLSALEAEKKRQSDHYKGKIDGLAVERVELAGVVRRQSEDRIVSCTWYADWIGKSMILRRDDTGEAVAARTMTAEECQAGFSQPEFQRPRTPKSRRLPEKRDESDDDLDTDEPPTVEPS